MSDTEHSTSPVDLTGKCLIAMPGMGDPRFAHSVVYLCAHSAEGAMGLIVNKPTDELRMRDLLDHLSITPGAVMRNLPVYFGGPVEHGRGFVLHDDGYRSDLATLNVDRGFGMTATLDILEDLAEGRGPDHAILALGYAGWGPGQLEQELAQNGWLTCDADADLVFTTPDPEKWEAALARLGVSALMLSQQAGHA
ncbi:YqgE/AlgH family protein [Roseovarius autotrophicus]|uniref:YqgE/AlgH family protein n=1 Tax=Roseovarius autotrophicus TaxID=2824121 RepID=UPI0019E147E9|nr:YqgE/AlgH family protein [Roseovarius autotrophicus]MBE0454165.1 YqgE/AlgH family protein [Roseovarius sp.]